MKRICRPITSLQQTNIKRGSIEHNLTHINHLSTRISRVISLSNRYNVTCPKFTDGQQRSCYRLTTAFTIKSSSSWGVVPRLIYTLLRQSLRWLAPAYQPRSHYGHHPSDFTTSKNSVFISLGMKLPLL